MNVDTLDRTIAPPSQPLEKVPFPEISLHRLSNGVPVYTVQFGTQEITELIGVFRAGRSFEPHTGVSSFTSSMLQEGTRSYTGLEFARKLNEFGAFINPETGFESASWRLSSLTKHLGNTIELLAEQILYPTFPEADLEKLKTRTIERLDVEEKKTGFRARKEFNRLLHGRKSPYGRIAEREDVAKIEMQWLRDFHALHYALPNGFFIACGRFDEGQLLDELEKSFGLAALYRPELQVNPENSQSRNTSDRHPKGLHYFEMKESMQATVRVGHKGLARSHPDFHRLQVVNTILGGYFGSRLMKNIREEKGYTYGIGSAWLSMKYDGTFLVQSDVGNEYIESTLTEIKKEMNLLIEKGVEEEELQLVKNYMLGRSVSARETPSQIANIIKTYLVNGITFSELDDKFDIVQNTTPEEVQQLAAKHLHPDAMLEVVAGKMDGAES